MELFSAGFGEAYHLERSVFLSVYRPDLEGAKEAITQFKPSPFSEAHTFHLGKVAIAPAWKKIIQRCSPQQPKQKKPWTDQWINPGFPKSNRGLQTGVPKQRKLRNTD